MDGVAESDWRDIQDSLNGEGDAYARLVRRYQKSIAAYIWRFTRDPVDHEELVHDVFVEAYLSLGTFGGKAPFVHWLRRIATRVGYRYWKRRARERAHPTVSLEAKAIPQENPEDPSGAAEWIHQLLSRLPARDQLVLTLLYFEECSVQEAAELTGWSRAMVKVQAFRARKKLRRMIENMNQR